MPHPWGIPYFSALPRLSLMLGAFFMPGTSLVLRLGIMLGVSLFPPLAHLVPEHGVVVGQGYDGYEGWEEEDGED